MVEHDYHGVVGMEQFSYSILEKIPSDSLFVIDGNLVSLALRREDATHRGIASNVYNQLLQMIDTVNNRAVLLANYQNPSCGYNHSFVPTLLNTGILTYSTTDLSYYKMSPSVGVDQFAGFCPNCALIQGFFSSTDGYSNGAHELALFCSSSTFYGSFECVGGGNYRDQLSDISWPLSLGHRYSLFGGEVGMCLWQVFGYTGYVIGN